MDIGVDNRSALLYLIDHVFLPPKLPQEDDFTFPKNHALLKNVLDALHQFGRHVAHDHVSDIQRAVGLVSTMIDCRPKLNLDERKVGDALAGLTPDGVLCFQLTGQNFGILITRQDQTVFFEQFELLASNNAVMSCQGRLGRSFPSTCISMQYSQYNASGFTSALTHCLAKLDSSTHSSCRPKSQKQGERDEERDTIDPRLSGLLNGFLRGLGAEANVVQIKKCSREEVLWDDARLPWHRSATWLSVRVTLQLIWSRKHKAPSSTPLFKSFIAFFMSTCVAQAQTLSIPDHLLYCMLAKLNRRCLKLSQLPYFENNKPNWLSYCSSVYTGAKDYLEKHWTKTQNSDKRPLPLEKLKTLSFTADSILGIPSFKKYTSEVKLEAATSSGSGSIQNHICLTLAYFETWIATNLSSWLENNIDKQNTCQNLSQMIVSYHSTASDIYRQNPFNLSVMWLSILELWVACDKAATQQVPLLTDYDTEIPTKLLEPLLLPSLPLMKRLHDVESYLQHRQARVQPGYPSIFGKFGHPHSFAVRFYDGSSFHQAIHQEILNAAESDRIAKFAELAHEKTVYERLRSAHTRASHEKHLIPRYNHTLREEVLEEECTNNCSKCDLETRMGNMYVSVHEWPLPTDKYKANAVIFELQVPDSIAAWRSVTLKLLTDMLVLKDCPSRGPENVLYGTSHYPELHKHQQDLASRLRILSADKPFKVAHYRQQAVPEATQQSICTPHGCRYEYYDWDDSSSFARSCSNLKAMKPTIPPSCSFANLSMFPLTHWIGGYTHTSNEIISQQSSCPANMALESFKAFRSYAVWPPTAMEESMPSIDFNQLETALVTFQSINEAGPCADEYSNVLRDAHSLLNDRAFALSLLQALRAAFHRVHKNWECEVSFLIYSAICTRLLVTSRDQDIRVECGDLLSTIRSTTRDWALFLLARRDKTDNEHEAEDFNRRAIGMSLACCSTFFGGIGEMGVIFGPRDSVTTYLEISAIIHDHGPAYDQQNQINVRGLEAPRTTHSREAEPLSPLMVISLQSWHRVCYLFQPFLADRICQDHWCIDNAISTFWAAYAPGMKWTSGGKGYRHVMTSGCCPSPGIPNIPISYDLFEGSLLVNGRPLSRLPPEYCRSPTYQRLFGSQSLKVSPSNEFGMQFTATRLKEGAIIHFTMKNEHLVVRSCKDGSKWDFILPEVLTGDFPESLIAPYSHWLNIESGVLEFRHHKHRWCSLGAIWRANTSSATITLKKDDKVLIDCRSNTAVLIGGILETLENPSYITIVLDKISSELEVDLPRYDLTFTLKPGSIDLRCNKYPGMCIDRTQSVGSLIGLKNKLVLRSVTETHGRKALVIPFGTPQVRGDQDCHPVTASLPTETKGTEESYSGITRRTHHYYEIDTILGRVVDNGSLRSKLLLCHLHATTSHCLIDPLTSRTGTEESLRILKSAAVASFSRLDIADAEMLFSIAKLSPARSFYPKHLMEMQNVKWNGSLHPLAQNDELRRIAISLLQQGESCEAYFLPARSFRLPEDSNKKLVDRAMIRNSVFRVDEYGAEFFTHSHDCVYQSRDTIKYPSTRKRERRLCHVTKLLLSQDEYLTEALPDADAFVNRIYSILGSEVEDASGSSDVPYGELDIHWLGHPAQAIGKNWRGIHHYLTKVKSLQPKFKLMTFFGALLFAPQADFGFIQLLVKLVNCPDVRYHQHPHHAVFTLGDGRGYEGFQILQCLERHKRHFHGTPESSESRRYNESVHDFDRRRVRAWESKVDSLKGTFESAIREQYPSTRPVAPVSSEMGIYFNVNLVMSDVHGLFQSWIRNHSLHDYLKSIAGIVVKLPQTHVTSSRLFTSNAPELACKSLDTLEDLCFQSTRAEGRDQLSHQTSRPLIESLHGIVKEPHDARYLDELRMSFDNYRGIERGVSYSQLTPDSDALSKRLQTNLRLCLEQVQSFEAIILASFDSHGTSFMPRSRLFFPRLSPVFILQQLNKKHWPNLPGPWRSCITNYALALTHLQRAQRMLGLVENKPDLIKEANNVGHSWDLEEFPDSLLMEVESKIIIRDVQEEVAASMRESQGNRALQLNMGEGKSSVIVQIVAAYLADGERLVRVIVAKPQSKQMQHMLVTKLGGLLDRRVFFLPFSRSIAMNPAKVAHIQAQFETCRKAGGVLLVQPEELLSFKLMALEHVGAPRTPLAAFSNSMTNTGHRLIKSQKYLDALSRDIIDESDENFSVKFELVYTIGSQRPTEMSPDRWLVIQNVLTYIARYAPDVSKSHPESIQLHTARRGQFAVLRFLKEEAGRLLLRKVARHICDYGCQGLPMSHQGSANRELIFSYITQLDVDQDTIRSVGDEKAGFSGPARNVLFLLRGLFAHGVLAFAFEQKRWRVNYGLTIRSPPTMLAVPYRAKDSPAPRSEFSHPDVVIVLTCLSYYYGGLSDDEMDTAFEHLERSDQSTTVYGEWVAGSPSLEPAYHKLEGINRKDRSQCLKKVFPALGRTKAVVDYYLAKVVFPKECMEFPSKLSASGWDLAKPRPQAVTGFSGTCDSKYVLPTDISYVDLPSQLHTNATVLSNLLRLENMVKLLGPDLSSEALLAAVVGNDTPIQVILDVGALIVDLENHEVARKWLEMTPHSGKEAVIFLSKEDEILVMDRNGFVEPFLTSSLVANTDACLVFLDEAHTRGIDLKLPDHYRAATMLGPKLTKDRLVQACMRMRKLGKGQSIIFFVPMEIQQKINALLPRQNTSIQVSDVLCWSISETWADTRRSVPLWALQGLRHQRQEAIWGSKIEHGDVNTVSQDDLQDYFEDEAMSLEHRYCPAAANAREGLQGYLLDLHASERRSQIELIQAKCEQFGVTNLASATLQEEQERELAPEVEQERQVEKPSTAKPLEHLLHPDVLRMIKTGELRNSGTAFEGAFDSLRTTSVNSLPDLGGFGQRLLVTTDFSRTVELDKRSSPDAFQRGVQWILAFRNSPDLHAMVILSPFEANALLPLIEKSPHVLLHVYLPRSNLALPSLQHLRLQITPVSPPHWEAPADLTMRLNLFAGQLYFSNVEEYKSMCAYLGLSYIPNEGNAAASINGFVGQAQYPDCLFTQSPATFLQFVMANVRRDRQDVSRTHVGRMLAGEILTEADFQNVSQ
ncbi:uncharacterized protein PG986_011804 [Apiospora aurea]|uniref:ubiquitinyl hydrolase 1 n=1 Tax=Apiospora aurea TaxID=335848 RepID=A0ABR1PY73_9PEZI